jgi:hypothetical protein
MQQIILFDSAYLVVGLNEAEGYWYYNWKGRQTADTVRSGGEKIYELFAQDRFSKVLNDNTLVTSSWPDATAYAGEDWFPRMAQAGLKKFAWVMPPFLSPGMSVYEAILKAFPLNVSIRSFPDAAQAYYWLNQDA